MDTTDIREWVAIALSLLGLALMVLTVVVFVRSTWADPNARRVPIRYKNKPSEKQLKAELQRALNSGIDGYDATELHDLRIYARGFVNHRRFVLLLTAQWVWQLGTSVGEPSFWRGFFVISFAMLFAGFYVFSARSTIRLGKAFLQRYPWPSAEASRSPA